MTALGSWDDVARHLLDLPGDVVEPIIAAMTPADQRSTLEAMVRLERAKIEPPDRFAERVLGFTNSPVHREWYGLVADESASRLAIVAPRDHGKSECLTVVQAAWRIVYYPGTWVYVFAATGDLAKALKSRIDEVVQLARSDYVPRSAGKSAQETFYTNGSRVTARGAGSAVRGAHPDLIIGDDVLEEAKTYTAYMRDKTARWWHGTVGGMAHPGTTRTLPDGRRVPMGATRVVLVGTPFHRSDLIMSMSTNALYTFRRYAAEFDPATLPDPGSLAVEIS